MGRRSALGAAALALALLGCSASPSSSPSPSTGPAGTGSSSPAAVESTTTAPAVAPLAQFDAVALAAAGPAPPPLPAPDPLPTDAWAPTPELVEGTIELPSIGVSEALHRGMTLIALNRGPSRWPGTAEPGALGNLVIGGHRTTWTRPFEHLDRLAPGDQMIVTTDGGRFVYEVTGSDIVDPADVHIAMQTYAHTATLFACHPKGSAAQRIVVRFQLLDDGGVPVDADATWNLGTPAPPQRGPATPPTLPTEDLANQPPMTFPEE